MTSARSPLATLDDGEVISRAAKGEREMLAELYRRYRGEAMRFIRHAVRHTHDADDILQEVFVEVSRSLRKFEGRAAFTTWLHRVCVRTAVRHMKRRYRQVGEADEPTLRPELPDPSATPHEGAETQERARRVQAMIEKIAPKKRMVLVLHDLEGVSPKEISKLVGAPVLTVRTRLFYARKELAAMAVQDPALAEFFAEVASGGSSLASL
ncbi:MAG: RNA polymerase sigma factor [Deltaproteobacteria bacterium]|nr:RNA polymerase sigma factor [Deltaproteobacteria bacterium]